MEVLCTLFNTMKTWWNSLKVIKQNLSFLYTSFANRNWEQEMKNCSKKCKFIWKHSMLKTWHSSKEGNKQNSDAFQCFDLAILYGFLVKSWGTLIQRNRLYSSWLIPSKLYESVTCWGSNHGANSSLPMIPLQA